MKKNPLQQLADCGQSFWMDTISREMIRNGTLKKMIREDGLRGVTSNPDIFQKAISGSKLYDEQIVRLSKAGKNAAEIYEALAVDDIKKAADILRSVYDSTDGVDGYISLEVSPYLAFDEKGTIEEAHRLWKSVDRPNVFIKVPATPAGIPVIRRLIADGINVNVTLIFSLKAYARVMEAYIAGIEERVKAGKPVRRVTSVASFFISRIDVLVDQLLGNRKSPAYELMGRVAVASGKVAYQDFRETFSGARWARLKKAGARVQRPLWASTSTKNPLYDEIGYVTPLIGPDTVNTMPMATIDAWRRSGVVGCSNIEEGVDEARDVLKQLKKLGVDLDSATWQIMEEGVGKFNVPFDKLLTSISEKRRELLGLGKSLQAESLGKYEKGIKGVLSSLGEARFAPRLMARDPSLFTDDNGEFGKIRDRLGWVDVAATMQGSLGDIQKVVAYARRLKLSHVALLGMGGSSLCPEVCSSIFGHKTGSPELVVLDTTSPDTIAASKLPVGKTLFIVSSKSGGTLETMSLYHYFLQKVTDAGISDPGSRFVAITDPGTSLEKLARKARFAHVFINPPDIGGRYSALSFFGLVPMALIGIDIKAVLQRVVDYSRDLPILAPTASESAVRLGAAMGYLALHGRDKVTILAAPELASFGMWVEQLIAESTGKLGRGILPVDENGIAPAKEYGSDRLFVSLKLKGSPERESRLEALEKAGHPVIRIEVATLLDIGVEFLRWEIAVAAAGMILRINPFDEPNVAEAKANTSKIIAQYEKKGQLPRPRTAFTDKGIAVSASRAAGSLKKGTAAQAVRQAAALAKDGDYLAILAFVPMNRANQAALEKFRNTLRARTGRAVTWGFGPRYLHSTGQLHKGGANNGVFIVIVQQPGKDQVIPEADYTFGTLIQAQGLGDFQTLDAHGRRAILVDLGEKGDLKQVLS